MFHVVYGAEDKDVNNEASGSDDFNRIGDLYHSTIFNVPAPI